MLNAGFMGYCQYCGKPCYRGDKKIESGRGKTKHVIYFHKRCYEIEVRKERKFNAEVDE